jgi:hypothetical protein
MKGDESHAPARGSRVVFDSGPIPFRANILLSCLLGATVIILYSPLLQFPFVQDDWGVLRFFRFHSVPSILADIFNPTGKFFFRPMGNLYCWLIYALFGLQPVGFHLLSVLLILASTFLVVSVAGTLTGNQSVAWGSGFLYAAAANIHLDPLMWMVGAIDIGAGLCALLSIGSFLKKRFGISALWFALAMGFKESAAMLMLVLVAWTLLDRNDPSGGMPLIRKLFNRLKWHSLAFLGLVAVKIQGISLFSLPVTDRYAARLIGDHIGNSFRLFAMAGLQAVAPVKGVVISENGALMTLFIVTAALVLMFIAGIRHLDLKEKELGRPLAVTLFILIWFLLMLIPSLTLENHFNRYYLAAALPPLVIGTMLVVKVTLLNTGQRGKFILYAMLAFVAANTIDGGVFVYRRAGLGTQDGIHASERDGDNHLIRKASMVREVWKPLLAVLPSVPPHSLLVLEGVETRCFEDKYGPQVWYGDTTLLVTSSVPADPDSLGMLHATTSADDAGNTPGTRTAFSFPASRTIHVRRIQGGMVLVHTGYRLE